MAKSNRIFALNLGMQTVGMAEFRQGDNGGLTLINAKSVELIIDPAADATRPAQIESAVAELRGALGAPAKVSAAVVLPSQSVFCRFVKLPGGSPDDVEQIIGFEAQQNVPFPIDEVVWDHQILGDARNGSWDVGLVAIKSDQLAEIVASVRKGGVTPNIIDAAPMALYNAFRFSYPDLQGASLLVDMGARTTNLIFIEGARLFSRTIPVGGNAVSAAVAKEFKQDITLAERLKIEKGFVGLGGAYAEPEDPTVAKISKVIRNTMTRLHAEIARSISFYRQSQGGHAPVRAFLCGGSVSLPYMAEFFGEKLQIPIEHFNPLGNVTVSSAGVAGELSARVHAIGELVGSGLRLAGACPVEINLRPRELVREQTLSKRKPFLLLAAACVLAAVGSWCAYYYQAESITRTKLAEVTSMVSGLKDLAGKLDSVAAERKKLEADIAPLLVAADERSAWMAILDELGKNLPPKFIWVTGIEPLSGGKPVGGDPQGSAGSTAAKPQPPGGKPQGPPSIDALQISGLYLSNPPNAQEARIIDEFVEKLQKSTVFKIEPNAKIVTQRTTPDGQSWAYGYTLVLPLAKPIALQ